MQIIVIGGGPGGYVAATALGLAGAVALGLFVSYAAMFGFDKLREALEQITNWGKDKTE